MKIIIYVLAIVAANIVTSQYQPFSFLGLIVPQGTVLVGLTFIFRDLVQMQYGRIKTYIVIGGALILSAISTELMGNGLRIVIASAVSFAISELMDTEIFTRWRGSLSKRVAFSGIVGSIFDSFVFTLIAGFPINAAFGQLIVKTFMQLLGAGVISSIRIQSDSNRSI